MESLGKDGAYSDSSLPPSAAREEYAVPDVIITHRLRDRELLRKRKAEAQEKDSIQWVLREQEKSKRPRRGRGARRGRGQPPATEPRPEPELEQGPQPDPQEEAEPAPSERALPEPALPEQPPLLTIQEPVGGMQPGAAEGELAARSQDSVGEEEVLKPAEAETPEALNTPLENDHQDNKYSTHVLF